MKMVFADTHYWLAIAKPNDQWKEASHAAKKDLDRALLVTTDEVLGEFLNGLSYNPQLRDYAVKMVRAILGNPNVRVVPQAREGFLAGLDRYAARQDKTYSLTDCISMNVMDSWRISEVLTCDRHFEQEGFTILIKKSS